MNVQHADSAKTPMTNLLSLHMVTTILTVMAIAIPSICLKERKWFAAQSLKKKIQIAIAVVSATRQAASQSLSIRFSASSGNSLRLTRLVLVM